MIDEYYGSIMRFKVGTIGGRTLTQNSWSRIISLFASNSEKNRSAASGYEKSGLHCSSEIGTCEQKPIELMRTRQSVVRNMNS